jgi:hypothetical protein
MSNTAAATPMNMLVDLLRYVPVPINFASCGPPPPLSYTETSAVRFPLTRGLKVTLIKQLAPEATLLLRASTMR